MAKRRPAGDGMVRKKEDGRWEGRIVVGHKDNGDPIFRYVYGKTQKELLGKLHQSIEQYQDVELTEDSRMTLAQWLDKWLTEYMPGTVRENTLNSYRMYCDRYVTPYLGESQVSEITQFDIQKMYAKLKREGRVHCHPQFGYTLSDAMICRIHTMLHNAMKTAEEAHLIAHNPVDGVTPPKPNYKPKQILNEKQLNIFLAAVDKDDAWRDFFYTELTTGLRRGEICGLKWQDLNEKSGRLKICRSISTRQAGEMTVGDPKTAQGNRTITLPASTAQRLRERKKTALTEWIFPNPLHPENPLQPPSAYHHLKTILKNAGLPDLRFHDLRHTFSTHALISGVDAKTLSSMLGHYSAGFTLDTYTHVTNGMQQSAADKVGGFMDEVTGTAPAPEPPDPEPTPAESRCKIIPFERVG